MPLTLVQEYFYFLTVAALYGSPIILLVLYRGLRKRAILKGMALVLAGLLLGAGLLQSSSQFSFLRESARYEEESRALADYSDVTEPVSSTGSYVGSERLGSYDYRVYQFPALDGSARWLEVVVPPPGINAAGYLRHNRERLPEVTTARLVIWTDQISLNPSLAPEQFFSTYLSDEQPYAFNEHTVLVNFRARRSTVIYPAQANEKPWIWRDAVNDL